MISIVGTLVASSAEQHAHTQDHDASDAVTGARLRVDPPGTQASMEKQFLQALADGVAPRLSSTSFRLPRQRRQIRHPPAHQTLRDGRSCSRRAMPARLACFQLEH